MLTSQIQTEASETLSSLIIAGNLDFPKADTIKLTPEGLLQVSGWLLPADPSQSLRIVIEGGSTVEGGMNRSRRDVHERRLDMDQRYDPDSMFGFSYDIPYSEAITLSVLAGDTKIPWKSIKIETNGDLEQALPVWDQYLNDRISSISAEGVRRVMAVDPEQRKTAFFNGLENLGKHLEKSAYKHFSPEEMRHVGRLNDMARSEALGLAIAESAIETGVMQVPSPFAEGVAHGCESIGVGDFVYLRFVCQVTSECFFLVQRITAVDAIYFPTRKSVLLYQHVNSEMILNFMHFAWQNFAALVSGARSRAKNKFLGIVASQRRPYHAYYDSAPGLQHLHDRGLLARIPEIKMFTGSDYVSFAAAFQLSCRETVSDWQGFNAECKRRRGYFFRVGVAFRPADRDLLRKFDARLIDLAARKLDRETSDEVQEARACYPLMWFGVTVQKRSWVQQIEGAVKIATALHQTHPHLGIVFDGWTSPLNKTKGDEQEAQADMEVVRQIIPKLPEGIRTFSVVGSTTQRKLMFATAVDFFVANCGTGSMHVARMARRPGVGHLNTLMDQSQHIHYHTFKIPDYKIINIPDPDNARVDFASYSVEPDDILEEILLWRLADPAG